MYECEAIYSVHVWCLHVGFREHHDVNFVFAHGVSNGVHLACFHEACGIPASKVESVLCWNFDVMSCPVSVVWLQYVVFKPGGSCVLFGV